MDTDEPLDPMLRDQIAALRSTPPATDLWPDIARQLASPAPRGVVMIRWPVAIAAGLIIAVATSASTAVLLRHHVGELGAAAAVAADRAPAVVSASFAPADAALSRAIAQLELNVRSALPTLAPAARTSVTTSLDALDRAIAQAALRQTAAPDDPRAARYLTSTLRKKLELLRTVSQLTRQQS
jgi:hypothetical protein